MVVQGNDAAGLKFELGDADAVFYEEDIFCAFVKNIEAAVFVPVEFARGGGVAQGLACRSSMVTLRNG